MNIEKRQVSIDGVDLQFTELNIDDFELDEIHFKGDFFDLNDIVLTGKLNGTILDNSGLRGLFKLPRKMNMGWIDNRRIDVTFYLFIFICENIDTIIFDFFFSQSF